MYFPADVSQFFNQWSKGGETMPLLKKNTFDVGDVVDSALVCTQ
jgi:hypothetical protein